MVGKDYFVLLIRLPGGDDVPKRVNSQPPFVLLIDYLIIPKSSLLHHIDTLPHNCAIQSLELYFTERPFATASFMTAVSLREPITESEHAILYAFLYPQFYDRRRFIEDTQLLLRRLIHQRRYSRSSSLVIGRLVLLKR